MTRAPDARAVKKDQAQRTLQQWVTLERDLRRTIDEQQAEINALRKVSAGISRGIARWSGWFADKPKAQQGG